MINFLKKLLVGETSYDYLIEGVMAHQYTDEKIKKEITDSYIKKYNPTPTPFTDPKRFDPLNPPEGWAYDPYYECWVKYQ